MHGGRVAGSTLAKKQLLSRARSLPRLCGKKRAGMTDGGRIRSEFLKAGDVVPDVVDSVEDSFLDMRVLYKELEVTPGLAMRKSQAQMKPHVELRGLESFGDVYYTLLMVDPDAPSPDDPKMRNFLHWMLINIPGSTPPDQEIWQTGKEVTEYMGPVPPKGKHRYVFLLFRQKGELNVSNPDSRGKFDVNSFAKQHELGKAVAGLYFVAQHDDTLDFPRQPAVP